MPFKMHKIFFSRKPEKNLGFTSKFSSGPVTLNTGIFLIWPHSDSEDSESDQTELFPRLI